jgi:hypothetical protein
MFSNHILRFAMLACVSLVPTTGFSTVPVGMRRCLSQRSSMRISCVHTGSVQMIERDMPPYDSERATLSRRATLPLVLAPLFVQPAFAADYEVFTDELGGSDGTSIFLPRHFPMPLSHIFIPSCDVFGTWCNSCGD